MSTTIVPNRADLPPPDLANAPSPGAVAPRAPTRPSPADDSPEMMNVIWRALVVSAVAILAFIVTVGFWAAGRGGDALLLLGGLGPMAAAMAFVSARRRARLRAPAVARSSAVRGGAR
jgi:hypothetical protein